MNKQEVKQKLHNLAFVKMNTKPDNLKLADVMQIVDQIDETEKPVIPQFVAKWLEYCKNTYVDLNHALTVGDVYFYNYANQKDFPRLVIFLETENNQELFARAWLDGYSVEQEVEE
ncbi:MAG: DUF1642 domain-containing protein [Streptococcus anginosus]|nr:DUF1642 domain-containing protein [Streptococcus anginosus]